MQRSARTAPRFFHRLPRPGTARLWAADGSKPTLVLAGTSDNWLYQANFSPDGTRIVTRLATRWHGPGLGSRLTWESLPRVPEGKDDCLPDGRKSE